MLKKILVVALVAFAANTFGQEHPAIIKLKAEKLHGRVREWPYPVHGITVPTSSPALLWPATNGKNMVKSMETGSVVPEDPNIGNVHYQVMLASDKAFQKNLITSGLQGWAVYPLHQSLKPGRWYWKYGYALKNSSKWSWSPVYDFVVATKNTAENVSPSVADVIKRTQSPHPRLWNMNKRGEDFYRNNLQNPEAKKFIVFCEKLMSEPLPIEKPRRIIDTTGKTPLEKKNIVEWMHHGFGDMVGIPIRNLVVAYQLTKDKRFMLDAKRRAINVLNMDPDGLATRDDFNSGAILENLGWFYDAGIDFLGEEEKAKFKKVIALRAKRIYDHLPNRFELHVSDNHVWQITLRNLAIATVATVNDIPEAKEWLSYIYEVWSARFPVLGTTDGGWHEGNAYFVVNFMSNIYLSQLFGDLSGVDYFKLPWMQNTPNYLMYTHPPRSASTAIGDMWENIPKINKGEANYIEALSYKIDNPYLNWYVAELKKAYPAYFTGTDDYLLFRLLNTNSNRKLIITSPERLPKTHKFADVGVVAMHQDLSNADKTLSSYLFSSPFGSSGHGHASQNAFTINYKGKVIFGGTGYYSNFSDKHNLLYYRTSRAYCTILADSLGQRLGEEGYGWIPRFIAGQHIQYALGDASNAYGDIKSEFWLDRFKQLNITANKTNGYGDAGVTLYRRHMLQLDGGYIVLYDELEARNPVKWTTQFHTPYATIEAQKTENANRQNFLVKTDAGNVCASVFGYAPLNMVVHHKFSEAALNWNKVNDANGNIKEFTDQWHAGITSPPAQKFKYLTIIQIKDGKTDVIETVANTDGLVQLKVGNWIIKAQLAGKEAAALQVSNNAVKSLFNYGNLPVVFHVNTKKPQIAGSSMLLEIDGGKLSKQEVVDEIPDVVKYDLKQ